MTNHQNPGDPERLLTVAQVATALRVSKMTVYRLIHTNKLTSIQVSRSFRVPSYGLDAYLIQA